MQRMPTSWITWQDALLMPEDGKRYEAIEGALHVTPAPTVRHQQISGNLFVALRALLHPMHGQVLAAPVGVEFPATSEGVQPDIVFVSKQRSQIVGHDWIRGAPDLVVEILSPGTADRDRTLKKKLYRHQGVADYWIVDPDAETVEVWDLTSGSAGRTLVAGSIPVRAGAELVGEISVEAGFSTP